MTNHLSMQPSVMHSEQLHIRDATGPCEVCTWPDDNLPKRLADALRARHGKGGLNVCRECIDRAKRIADVARGIEPKT